MISLASDFITVRHAGQNISQVVDRAQEGRPQVITRSGLPAAVLVDVAQFDLLQRALALVAADPQLRAQVAGSDAPPLP
ncbi:MAG TPA: type II toxin-antitoxin system Phd/YefM family antitoxin [Chloroflexia bacterium]|nr:type II toxin-antitoxin system Phd/YefM family antitoxin [Chloroflexia bacterium]